MSVNFTKLHQSNDEQAIVKAIESLHKRGNSLQLDIHRVLVAICTRWASSGDVRPVATHINLLLQKDNLSGIRKNAIKAWVETFMGLVIVTEGENSGSFYCPKGLNDGKHLDIKELTNNRWWEFKPEPQYVPITDPIKLVSALVKKLEKDVAKMGQETKVSPEMLEQLKGLTQVEPLH